MFRMTSLTCAAMALVAAPCLHAAVVINGTRIIFPASSRDVSVRIENRGADPALVQAWIDDGDEQSSPETAQAPFAITPPVFRIDPSQGHALRLVHTGASTPADHEVLYWLNVLEIPPKVDNPEGKNMLQFAFRHRLKLMHRPKGLKVAPAAAPTMLRWSLVGTAKGKHLKVENPSPYVVSFNAIALESRERDGENLSLGGGMVLPGASAEFSVPDGKPYAVPGRVAFATINDYGAVVQATADVSP